MGKAKKQSFVQEVQSAAAFHIQPKNPVQDFLLQSIKESVMTVAVGPAGTGKTYCSGMMAAQCFLGGGYDKIIVTRPNIATGKTLGHFPGTIEEKMAPWLKPIFNVLEKGLGKGKFEYLTNKKQIEIQPLETIRGNSFENCIVIADEVQNLTMEELKALTTRVGDNSKLVLMGDATQSDIKGGSDLERFVSMCAKHNIQCPIVRFNVDHIVRSELCASLVKMFYAENM